MSYNHTRRKNRVSVRKPLSSLVTKPSDFKVGYNLDKLLAGQRLSITAYGITAKREGDAIGLHRGKGKWFQVPIEETDIDELRGLMKNFDKEWQGRVGQHMER